MYLQSYILQDSITYFSMLQFSEVSNIAINQYSTPQASIIAKVTLCQCRINKGLQREKEYSFTTLFIDSSFLVPSLTDNSGVLHSW